MKIFIIVITMTLLSSLSIAEVPPPSRKDSARQLIIQLNNDYNLLNTELKELEDEMQNFPKTTLNISVVNKMLSKDTSLVSIEIQDNARLIASHIYSNIENEALAAGGRHQILEGEVREGNHVLKITYCWRVEGSAIERGETYAIFSISKGMTYFVELFLKTNKNRVTLESTQFEFSGR